uniref:Uncharacterized protein n=1 Tax=Mycena chlorophos TaxID=658473 RepID=A0ABQ0L7R1_MYCCL|nr:predicted protein [Mycena chlorophos]
MIQLSPKVDAVPCAGSRKTSRLPFSGAPDVGLWNTALSSVRKRIGASRSGRSYSRVLIVGVHRKQHKPECNEDDSEMSTSSIAEKLYKLSVVNPLLQDCFVSAFEMLSLPHSFLRTQPFVAAIDVLIEPVQRNDLTALVSALKSERKSQIPVPDALYKVAAMPQLQTFLRQKTSFVPKQVLQCWKEMRYNMDVDPNPARRNGALGIVCMYKAHSVGISESFLCEIDAAALDPMRNASDPAEGKQLLTVAENLLLANTIIQVGTKREDMFGLRAQLSKRDIGVIKDYVEERDLMLEGGKVPYNNPYYPASLLRKHVAELEEVENRGAREEGTRRKSAVLKVQ